MPKGDCGASIESIDAEMSARLLARSSAHEIPRSGSLQQ